MSSKANKSKKPTTAATQVLDRAGVKWTPHVYQHDPRSTSFGLETAESLGIEAERVFKTLVVDVGNRQGIAIIPASHSLNLKAAASALEEAGAPHARTAGMADERTAQAVTGYVIGGISPLGTKKRLPTVLDGSATNHKTILVSGGRRGFSVELSPADLAALTGAVLRPTTR